MSIRVAPDTSGFKNEVETFLRGLDLKVRVNLDFDRDRPPPLPPIDQDVNLQTRRATSDIEVLRRRLAALSERLVIDADPTEALREIERLETRIRAAAANLEVNADTAGARAEVDRLIAEINRRRASIDVDVDTDRRGAGRGLGAFGGLSGIFGSLFSAGSKLPGLLGSIGGALGDGAKKGLAFGNQIKDMIGDVGGFAGAVGKAAPVVGAIAGTFGNAIPKLIGFGGQLAVLGALAGTVLYALGGVGVLLGALPALAAAAGAGLGTVLVGMDGIKAAFKGFGADMKKQVSDVFERGLKPVVENLTKNLLPTLTTEFKANATQMVGMADAVGRFLTSADGLKVVRTVFQGFRTMLDQMVPGLKAFAQGLIDVANTRSVYVDFGQIIGGLAERFGLFFSQLAQSGTLAKGMTLLKDVILAAADAFFSLLQGATDFFVAAGPGVTHVFESISGFIQKIDFTSLGESFGVFTDAIGTLIDSVPPGFFQDLADSFRDLALKVKELAEDPGMQKFFLALLELIPAAIDSFTSFLGALRAVVNFVKNFAIQVAIKFVEVKIAVQNAVDGAKRKVGEFVTKILEIKQRIVEFVQNAAIKFAELRQRIKDAIDRAKQAVVEAFQRMVIAVVTKLAELVQRARELPGKVKAALGNIGSLLVASGRALVDGFIRGILGMVSQVAAAARRVAQAARNVFPFSPAKEGPFSGRGWVLYSGLAVGQAFADGMDRQQGVVRSAALGLVDGAATLFGETGAYAAAGASAAEAYANGLGGIDTARAGIVAAVRADASITGRTDEDGQVRTVSDADATAIGRAMAGELQTRGLKLDTESGEVIAKLNDRGARRLDRRGRAQ